MVSPSALSAARTAPDRRERIRLMAETMRERAATDGACDRNALRAEGFTEAEIVSYADDARALLSDRQHALRVRLSPGKREGLALVKLARRIRRCQQSKEVARG
ncbi:hypothetical protein GGR34_003734 [Microvirga flocculans]|uniref:Uncharacterized protein n=1 Tax=Microvirga flocculans TaxID=217168 RepID=A0A7W6IID5_9HYPH|nr:hypothetical protein [Microvirga flocculans]MBB4042049.1 hypothetical protein [Microvirga flocculans]